MAITGIRSRWVVAAGGGILIVLGLVPVLGAFVAVVPTAVLGGAGIALFGTVAASGIRTLSAVDYEGNSNLVIVGLALGMGLIPIAVPKFWDAFPAWFGTIFHSGITAAAITAVVLNAIFTVWGHGDERREGPVFSEAPPMSHINTGDEDRLRGRSSGRVDRGQGRDVPLKGRARREADPGDGSQA